jgi:hypothetical protein
VQSPDESLRIDFTVIAAPPQAVLEPNPLVVNLVYIFLVLPGVVVCAIGLSRLARQVMSGNLAKPWKWPTAARRVAAAVAIFVAAVAASHAAGVGDDGKLPGAALGWPLLLHVERAALLIGSITALAMLVRALFQRAKRPLSRGTAIAGFRTLLIVLGMAMIAAAIVLRTVNVETSKLTETTDTSALGATPSGAKPVAPTRAKKTSATRTPLADSVMVSLVGFGAALVLVSAFFKSIKKLRTPFGDIDVALETQDLPARGPRKRIEAADATAGAPSASLEPLLTQEAFKEFHLPALRQRLAGQREVRVAILGADIDPELAAHPVFGGRVETPVQEPGATGELGVMGSQVALVAAMSSEARILPIAVFDHQGHGRASSVIIGLQSALSWQPHVVLLDFGYPPAVEDAEIEGIHPMRLMLERVTSQGALAIAPAGNDRSERPHFPANDPDVVGCSALDRAGTVADFSSTGASLAAPGVNIASVVRVDQGELILEPRSGTSIAAGFVTAVATLALAANRNLEPAAMPSLLYSSGVPLEGGGLMRAVDPQGLATAVAA